MRRILFLLILVPLLGLCVWLYNWSGKLILNQVSLFGLRVIDLSIDFRGELQFQELAYAGATLRNGVIRFLPAELFRLQLRQVQVQEVLIPASESNVKSQLHWPADLPLLIQTLEIETIREINGDVVIHSMHATVQNRSIRAKARITTPQGQLDFREMSLALSSEKIGLTATEVQVRLPKDQIVTVSQIEAELARSSQDLHARFIVDGLSFSMKTVEDFYYRSQPGSETEEGGALPIQSLTVEMRNTRVHEQDSSYDLDLYYEPAKKSGWVRIPKSRLDLKRLIPGESLLEISGGLNFSESAFEAVGLQATLTQTHAGIQAITSITMQGQQGSFNSRISIEPWDQVHLSGEYVWQMPRLLVLDVSCEPLSMGTTGLVFGAQKLRATIDFSDQIGVAQGAMSSAEFPGMVLKENHYSLTFNRESLSANVKITTASLKPAFILTALPESSHSSQAISFPIPLSLIVDINHLELQGTGYSITSTLTADVVLPAFQSEPVLNGLMNIQWVQAQGFGLQVKHREKSTVQFISDLNPSQSAMNYMTNDIALQLQSMWNQSSRKQNLVTGLVFDLSLLVGRQEQWVHLKAQGPWPDLELKFQQLDGKEQSEEFRQLLIQIAQGLGASGSEGGSFALPGSLVNQGLNSLIQLGLPPRIKLHSQVLGAEKALGIKAEAVKGITIGIQQSRQDGKQDELLRQFEWKPAEDFSVEFENVTGDSEESRLQLRRMIRF